MVSAPTKPQVKKQSFWNRKDDARSSGQSRTISRPAGGWQTSGATTSAAATAPASQSGKSAKPGEVSKAGETSKPDHPILFQTWFKSVGPRTYAAQVKRATNGNQYLVITEGRRDKNSDQIRKNRLNVFSEDFEAFFNLLRETTRWLKDHPLPPEFQKKRKQFWNKTKSRNRSATPKS